jgi:hypothetical protein
MALIEKEDASIVSTLLAKEWFDEVQDGSVRIELPEPDGDYFYTATRLLSWYPVINSKGATYEKEDFDEGLLSTLIGKQANLTHDKAKVIGSIFAVVANDEGIDVGVRIDREQADIHGLDPEDLRDGNCFSHVSVELTKDPAKSYFYIYDEGFNVKNRIPVLKGRDQGIRRSTASDPYRLMGNRVAERIKPARFTGVGFVPNPADKTAKLYAVAASDDSEETLKPDLTSGTKKTNSGSHPHEETHTQASSDAVKEKTMTDEEIKAIQDRVAELEAQVKDLDTQRETAATAAAESTARIAELEKQLSETASERDALKAEKETAAREARIDTLLSELEAIKPAKDDEDRAKLRETAAFYCDDAGVIKVLKLERENEALKEQIAEAKAAVESTKDADEAAKVAAAAAEKAAEEKETFSAEAPKVSIAPTYIGADGKPLTEKDLLALF